MDKNTSIMLLNLMISITLKLPEYLDAVKSIVRIMDRIDNDEEVSKEDYLAVFKDLQARSERIQSA
jgi:hypothetical protein